MHSIGTQRPGTFETPSRTAVVARAGYRRVPCREQFAECAGEGFGVLVALLGMGGPAEHVRRRTEREERGDERRHGAGPSAGRPSPVEQSDRLAESGHRCRLPRQRPATSSCRRGRAGHGSCRLRAGRPPQGAPPSPTPRGCRPGRDTRTRHPTRRTPPSAPGCRVRCRGRRGLFAPRGVRSVPPRSARRVRTGRRHVRTHGGGPATSGSRGGGPRRTPRAGG